MIKKVGPLLFLALITISFRAAKTLKGTYEYAGGVYNGKADGPSSEYKLRRLYDGTSYQAKVIVPGEDTLVYEKGNYALKADTCLETQIYCRQKSKWLNVTLHYGYKFNHDTLTFSGTLPNGTTVQEFWKKIK